MVTITYLSIFAGTVILKSALTYWNYLCHSDMGQSIGIVGQTRTGMAKLVFLDDYLRFEDLEKEAPNDQN